MTTQEAVAYDTPLSLWPTWGRDDGFAALARFVSIEALKHTPLGGAEQTLREGLTKEEGDLALARERFACLQSTGIRYGFQPYRGLLSDRQQIRHPWWMTIDRIGTCVDLAVAYASMCLEAEVAPLLALSDDHAWVVLRPGALAVGTDWFMELDETPMLPGTEPDEEGVVVVRDVDALNEAVQLIAVDAVAATRPAATFADATRDAAARMAPRVRLIDVAWLFENRRVEPHPAPTRPRVGIRLYLPGGTARVTRYRLRPAPETLLGKHGIFILHGVQGSGKSTLARAAVAAARHGAAWFLDASSRQALIDSLARAELAERDERGNDLTDQSREGYAFAALARLRTATDPWLVVLDNADGRPAPLRALMPRPGPEQVVIVTTTNPDWIAEPGITDSVSLTPLIDAEVEEELGRNDLVPLVAGRPLLLEAFRALAGFTEVPPPDPGFLTADALADPLTGPRAFWHALRTSAVRDEQTERLCATAALLPPDYQPASLLEELAGAPRGFVDLARRGLFTWDEDNPAARLHRLFGASIREDLAHRAPAALDEAALRIVLDQEGRSLLDRRGDPDTTRHVAERLIGVADSTTSADEQLGTALHHLAWVLELKGDTPGSGQLYDRARGHLIDGREEIVSYLADCLHGSARTVNQQHANDEERLHEAIGWAEESERLLLSIGREDRIGRPRAMKGLLLQKTARFAGSREERRRILHAALDILIDADRRRGGLLPHADDPSGEEPPPALLADDDPERARSTFNLAGIRILLAKVEREQSGTHLDAAATVYATVRDFRKRVYEVDVHPHIAACDNGLAVVSYYRAMLLPATTEVRTEWLRAAQQDAQEALVQREVLDGDEDLKDSQKTLEVMAKIAAARTSLGAGGADALKPLQREFVAEISQIDLPEVEPLTSDSNPLAHVQGWVTSRALARLVAWFNGTPPRTDNPLAASLADLDEFSQVWDARGDGRERNQIGHASFSVEDELLVDAACSALGLNDMQGPPRTEYDHVLILGGLARACLGRPLAASRLVADGAVNTKSVIALGGFRPLNESERGLLATLGVDGCECELDVIDIGVRRAFAGYRQPDVQQGGTTGPDRWQIHTYAAHGSPLLRVIAAPAPSAQQRATTGSTYAWLAGESGLLQRGQSLLIITTHHYRPYQLADAICELSLPLNLTIDAFGMSPGAYDSRLAYSPSTAEYLQEVRSTIRAYRRLVERIAH